MGIIDNIKQLVSERRSRKSDLENPRPWLVKALGLGPSATGKNVTPEKALNVSAVYSCVKVLSETIASLPLPVYRTLPQGKERAKQHHLYKALHNQPNPEMTSFTFRETLQGHLCLWGNAYAEIAYDGGARPKHLWPLLPNKTWPERDKSGNLTYVTGVPGSKHRRLPKERVLHIVGYGYEGLVGLSPIGLHREAVGLSLATEEYGARFFGNDSRPSGILKHPHKLKDEEVAKRMKRQWEEAHSGLENKHRIAILEEGVEWQQIGVPPEDSQFLETRKFQINEIARIFRVPPHMIGDLERATFSNIEEQSLEFVQYTLQPWLVRWEQEMNRKLFNDPYFTEFLIDGLLRGDIQSRYNAYSTARQWGWMSANDVRELENMNPVEGGDKYLIPMNMVPTDQLEEVVEEEVEDERTLELRRNQLETEHRKKQRRSATSRHMMAMRFERTMKNAVDKIVKREAQNVRRNARKHLNERSMDTWEAWLNNYYEDFKEFIDRNVKPALMTLGEAINEEAAQEVGAEPGLGEMGEKFIDEYTEAYIARHNNSSKGQIEALVRDAIEQEEDPAEYIEQRMDEWEERRAGKEAKNEIVQLSNAVAVYTFSRAGMTKLRWIGIGTDTCEFCAEMDGKVVGIEEYFVTEDQELEAEGREGEEMEINRPTAHPPLHQSCVCQVVAER